jgi:hypothetical protein
VLETLQMAVEFSLPRVITSAMINLRVETVVEEMGL